MQETQESRVQSLGWEESLEWEMQPTPVFLPGKFQGQRRLAGSMGSQRVGYDWATTTTTIQFRSVQSPSHVRLFDPMNCSMPGLPVYHQLPEFTQTHVHRVGDAIQPSLPLSSPSTLPPIPPSIRWVNSSHEVAKVLEFQLQHQSFQWIPRTDLL